MTYEDYVRRVLALLDINGVTYNEGLCSMNASAVAVAGSTARGHHGRLEAVINKFMRSTGAECLYLPTAVRHATKCAQADKMQNYLIRRTFLLCILAGL